MKIKSTLKLFVVIGICLVFDTYKVDYCSKTFAKKHGHLIEETLPIEPGSSTIQINVMNNVAFNVPNEIKVFSYMPLYSGFYTLETFGSVDTIIEINNNYTGTICDDNSGVGNNGRIDFIAQIYVPISIRIKLKNNALGSTTMQIRKQKLSSFGFSGGGINTIPDLNAPYNSFSGIFDCSKYENANASYALSNDERSLSRINSEIMFFSGHGCSNNVSSSICFDNNSAISTNDTLCLNQTKFSLLAGCETGVRISNTIPSIAEYFVDSGSKSSIGFNDIIGVTSSKVFTDFFFARLVTGGSIYESAQYAAWHILWPWDSIKNYSIFGDGNIRIVEESVSNYVFELPILPNSVDTDLLIQINNGFIETGSDNMFVYYEEINNTYSSNVIILEYENDVLVNTIDGTNPYFYILDVNPLFVGQPKPQTLTIDNNVWTYVNTKISNVIYYNFEGIMTPVELNYCSFQNSYGYSMEMPICFNLANGNMINYQDIYCLTENQGGNGNLPA